MAKEKMYYERIKVLTKFEDVKKIAREISRIKGVKAVYLFGSYASGTQKPYSDIDLCVITDKISEKTESEIIGFSSDNLDISIFHRLPIYIKFRVFKEGKPLLIKEENFVNRLKVRTFLEYMDFKPLIIKHCMKNLKCTI